MLGDVSPEASAESAFDVTRIKRLQIIRTAQDKRQSSRNTPMIISGSSDVSVRGSALSLKAYTNCGKAFVNMNRNVAKLKDAGSQGRRGFEGKKMLSNSLYGGGKRVASATPQNAGQITSLPNSPP